KRVARYEERGVTVVKATGRIAGPGRVEADGRTLEAAAIIVATGADAVIPPIPGLADIAYWTNREATALTEIPESVVFIGGGVVATGRRPRTKEIGRETVGVEPGPRGIAIDSRCRAAEGVWAIGDVTGTAMFTHVAKYQARIAAMDILGKPACADYRAVPRVVF